MGILRKNFFIILPGVKYGTDDDKDYEEKNFYMTANYTKGYDSLNLSPNENHQNHFSVICQTLLNFGGNCVNGAIKITPLELLLDPNLQSIKKQATTIMKKNFKDMFHSLNQTTSYKGMFSSLWYSSLPCFDTKDMTSDKDGEKSLLKYCEWKGIHIPCAAIFTNFPTDQGMCCSFNIKSAEEIFKGNTYPPLVHKLQMIDKNSSFDNSISSINYTTLPGRNKGLVLMIDAHTDILAPGSLDSDFKGFIGLVSPSGSFPFTIQEGFEIRPGHKNIIALTGSKIDADESLKDLSIDQRKCLFSDENSDMIIHKNYTQSNCLFECALIFARNKVKDTNKVSYACTPWYFPSAESEITVCDPWESAQFFEFMFNGIPDDTCSYCLPDCSTTIYETSFTAIPFRRCDSNNVGVSTFCKLDDRNLPSPTKFGQQVITEFENDTIPSPRYVKKIESNIRTYATRDIFTQNPKTYDAYDEDIAIVQIYFKKSTVVQMKSEPRMTWIDYFSAVGGLMGLVLGMGIVSVIELMWLCLRLLAWKGNFTHIIP
jgi:amiloride-sensitive sodium channel